MFAISKSSCLLFSSNQYADMCILNANIRDGYTTRADKQLDFEIANTKFQNFINQSSNIVLEFKVFHFHDLLPQASQDGAEV